MRATKFEFENRFWFIGILFWIGFSLSAFDHVNAGVRLLRLVAPGTDPDSTRGLVYLRIIFALGALLVYLAAFFRTWATSYLRTRVVHDGPLHAEALVADGPYRYVRNPLYAANFPLFAGVGVLASGWGWIFMLAGCWIFHLRLILREEHELMESQGESYRAYLAKVPRLIPSLTPRLPSAGGVSHWGQAFLGEMFIWLFGVGVTSFAVTLNIRYSLIIFTSSLAIYFAAVFFVKKRNF